MGTRKRRSRPPRLALINVSDVAVLKDSLTRLSGLLDHLSARCQDLAAITFTLQSQADARRAAGRKAAATRKQQAAAAPPAEEVASD